MASRKARRRKLLRKRISAVITAICFIVLAGCVAYLWREIGIYKQTARVVNSLRNSYNSTASADTFKNPTAAVTATPAPIVPVNEESAAPAAPGVVPTQVPAPTEIPAPTEEPEPVLQARFAELYEQNNEMIGWITVNENVQYPIVWKENDNDFYMDHDYYGNSHIGGWIFLDKRNLPDMSDDHMLIYGHNMRNGTMFGSLDDYRKLSKVKENPIIEVHSAWEAEPRKYVLISLFDASMNRNHSTYIKITNFNFELPEEKQDFIDRMCARSVYDLPFDATADDQLVTLVTCSYDLPNARYLLVARELREDETEEQIREAFAALE